MTDNAKPTEPALLVPKLFTTLQTYNRKQFAAIVLWVAYRMAEWRVFKSELSAPKNDAIVMLVTFLLTALVDLTVGIGVGWYWPRSSS